MFLKSISSLKFSSIILLEKYNLRIDAINNWEVAIKIATSILKDLYKDTKINKKTILSIEERKLAIKIFLISWYPKSMFSKYEDKNIANAKIKI